MAASVGSMQACAGRGRAHEIEGAVRRDERDGAVIVEARQSHALVEFDVLQVHTLVLAAAALRLEQHLRTAAAQVYPIR